MNKLFIGGIIILAIGIGWFILSPGDTFDYVVTVDDEVTQLEEELTALDIAVQAGTLTPEQATEAKIKILNRLDTINSSITESTSAKLTPAQQKQLSEGLDRLKNILITYQATLTTIDEAADEEIVKQKIKRGIGSSKKLHEIVVETIDTIEDNVVETVDEYIPSEDLDEQIDEILDNEATTTDETTDEEDSETMATTTESGESTTTDDGSDETTVSDEDSTSTEETTDATDEDEEELVP